MNERMGAYIASAVIAVSVVLAGMRVGGELVALIVSIYSILVGFTLNILVSLIYQKAPSLENVESLEGENAHSTATELHEELLDRTMSVVRWSFCVLVVCVVGFVISLQGVEWVQSIYRENESASFIYEFADATIDTILLFLTLFSAFEMFSINRTLQKYFRIKLKRSI